MRKLRIFMGALALATAGQAPTATLELEAKIALPECQGRIDHLAYDSARQRLFVAELGNDSVAVVSVKQRRLEHRLEGLKEPQGIAFFEALQRVYVANGGDGAINAYDGGTLELLGTRKLGKDADNIRVDAKASRIYVGYGDGALAALDATTLKTVANIALDGHPESFQLSRDDGRVYINVPDAQHVAVVDRNAGRQIAAWPAERWSANYPMAHDATNRSVLAVFRKPAMIVRYSTEDGGIKASASVCGDADDLFVDAQRDRLYVICGEGVVDVLNRHSLTRIDRIATAPGARTGLYSSEADALFVAARATGRSDAALWVFKPR
jgi:DNA-binding beta-propeller fold protein YncE